jgi:hypothetical protein
MLQLCERKTHGRTQLKISKTKESKNHKPKNQNRHPNTYLVYIKINVVYLK